MNFFVNVYENSYGQAGRFYTFRLYSGDSLEGLKSRVAEDLMGEWEGVSSQIDDLSGNELYGMSFDELENFFNDVLENSADLMDYSLEIGKPYTDLKSALDFYDEFSEIDEDEFDLEHYEEKGFYCYGEYAIKIQHILGYLDSLRKDYSVTAGKDLINKILKFGE